MVGYSGGVKSSDVFGTFSSMPACGSTLQESIPLNPPCPQCNSKRLWRDSKRYTAAGDEIQRWLCRDCGLRFSDPMDLKNSWTNKERAHRTNQPNELKTAQGILYLKPNMRNRDEKFGCRTTDHWSSAEQQSSRHQRQNH